MLRLHTPARLCLLFVMAAVSLACLLALGRTRTTPPTFAVPQARQRAEAAAQEPAGRLSAGKLSAGKMGPDQAPFDVGAVVEQVQRSFETTEHGFRGGRAEYGVRASVDGIALTARHWQHQPGQSPSTSSQKTQREPRQATSKPVESPELELRTKYVGRGAVAASDALGEDDIPVLEDDAQLVAWQRDNHTEHLRQTSQGVEQSWEFPAKPEGRDDLVVRVNVSGLKYVNETANGLHFADARGLGFRYGHGTWVDAAGVKTAVAAHYANGEIELSVPRDVVERSAYPAVLDPVVGPEFGFQPVTGAADGATSEPSIASNGTDYLVVWNQRVAWTQEGSKNVLRATRVNAAGTALDAEGLTVSAVEDGWLTASVASNGTDFLIAWRSRGEHRDIHANRVTAAGDVLDGTGIAVATGGPSDEGVPSVASNGSDYLVTWADARSGNSDIYANRVSTAGEVQDASGIAVSTADGEQKMPCVASNGTDYLIAWADLRSGTDNGVYASRVSAAGQVLDTVGLRVSTGVSSDEEPKVASNGSVYLVAWESENYIRRGRVTADGSTFDDGILAGFSDGLPDDSVQELALASNGTDFLAAWVHREEYLFDDFGTDYRYYLQAARLGASGEALGTEIFKLTGRERTSPSVASAGGDYLVVSLGRSGVRGNRVTATGSVIEPETQVSVGGNAELGSSLASNGTDFLVVWVDQRSGWGEILASRVSATGVVLDPTGLVVGTDWNDESDSPSVASNGSDYLVVWRGGERDDSENDGQMDGFAILARAVSAAGVLQPVQQAPSRPDPWNPSVASDGSGYLITWEEGAIFASRASAAGELQDERLLVSEGQWDSEAHPEVASNGSEYLVVWQAEVASSTDIFARRVPAAGKLKDEAFAVSTTPDEQRHPAVASDGTDYLVTWQDRRSGSDWDIYASRVTATGQVQDASGTPVVTAASNQRYPQIASNGSAYLVTWQDTRTGSTQVYGARMTFAPVVQTSEFLITSNALPLGIEGDEDSYLSPWKRGGDRAVVSAGGRYLVSYGLDDPNGVPKIGLRLVTEDCHADPAGDADGDGTGDCADQCPNDPEKVTDFDLDVDGTLNCNDSCPTNPKKKSPGVCGCNASEADTDGDGTPDCEDACPEDEQDACVHPSEGGAGGASSDVPHAGEDDSSGEVGSGDDSGCGCRTVGGPPGSASGVVVLLAGLGLIVSRRRLRAA